MDELRRSCPVVGEPGLSPVVPTGITNPSVPDITSFPVSASSVISSPAVVDVTVVFETVKLPIVASSPATAPTPNVPVYLAPHM